MILKPPKFILPNRGHSLTKGLVGCWLLNEGTGYHLKDNVGNADFVTVGGSPDWMAGKFGSALNFVEASSEYFHAPAPITNYPVTMLIWVRVTADYPGNDGYIFGLIKDTSNFIVVGLCGGAPNLPYVVVKDATGMTYVLHTKGTPQDEWHQVAVTVTSDCVKRVWLDGEPSSPESTVKSPSGIDTLFLGGSPLRGLYESAVVDHTMLWDRVLSSAEMMSLYLNPFQMFQRRPIELWTAAMAAPSQTILDYERGTRGVNRGIGRGAA